MCVDTARETCRRASGINSLYITPLTGQGSLWHSPAAGQRASGKDTIDLGPNMGQATPIPVSCSITFTIRLFVFRKRSHVQSPCRDI